MLSILSATAALVLTPAPIAPTLHAAVTLPRAAPARCALEVVDPSYNLALGSIALGAVFGVPGSPLKNRVTAIVPGALFALFGLFIAFQTTTLRFTFDDDSFALVKADLSTTGENVVVGGANDWAYSSFVNWDFLPSESFPILVYFRETQTPAAGREEVPLVIDELDGQVHFFPAISNVQALKTGFTKAGCAKL